MITLALYQVFAIFLIGFGIGELCGMLLVIRQ